MKQKLLSILALLLMAATGAWAEIITWDASNVFNESHMMERVGVAPYSSTSSATYAGITISFSGSEPSFITLYDETPFGKGSSIQLFGDEGDSFTFTASEGKKFAKIEINGSVNNFDVIGDWTQPSGNQIVWSGTAVNAVTLGGVYTIINPVTSIVFYLADAAVTAKEGASGEYWATYYNATQGFTADANTTVFQAALSGNQLTMTEVANREIPAGKAVILKSSSSTILLTAATTTATLNGNALQGTATAITNPGNAYVLNKKAGVVGFYKLQAGKTIAANKAYLTYSGGAGAREFFPIDENGMITGIEMPKVEMTNSDAEVYDLQGRQVVNPTKGLYIVNGKKVFINK